MRLKHQQELAATHAAWIMNMWRKKGSAPIRPHKLLGRSAPILQASNFKTVAGFVAAVNRARMEAGN